MFRGQGLVVGGWYLGMYEHFCTFTLDQGGKRQTDTAESIFEALHQQGMGCSTIRLQPQQLREKKTLLLYCKTTGLLKICRFTPMIKNYGNRFIYGNTMLFYTEWELEQMLGMAVMMLCDDSDKLMAPFCNTEGLLLCLVSKLPIVFCVVIPCEVGTFHL